MSKTYIFLMALMLSTNSFAGLHAVTHHSRANCINNESISWHKGHYYMFWVNSEHRNRFNGALIHYISTGWERTWRQAAVHYGEGYLNYWAVYGRHWMMNTYKEPYLAADELVTDCSIYDGWWD